MDVYYNRNGENMNIICIGHAAYDVTFPFDHFPIENTKNRVTSKIEALGGCACTASYMLAKWGGEPYFLGCVGNDVFGNKILSDLEKIGVKTDYTQVKMNTSTTESMIVVNQENGSRTIYSYVNEEEKLDSLNLDFEPDFILMDGYEGKVAKELLKKYPSAISVLDAGRITNDVLDLCMLVNYVVCSKEFLEGVTGITLLEDSKDTFIRAYRKLEERFKNTIVVTLESRGALYKYQNQVKIMPSMKVKAVDTTGAGDIFHAAFIYGLSKNLPFEEIIKLSNIAGALSVTKLGGSTSIPSIVDMKKVYHDFE